MTGGSNRKKKIFHPANLLLGIIREWLHFNSSLHFLLNRVHRVQGKMIAGLSGWHMHSRSHTHIHSQNACIRITHALAGGEGKLKIDAKGSPRQPTGNRCCQQPRRSMGGRHRRHTEGGIGLQCARAPHPHACDAHPLRGGTLTPAWCGTQTGELSCLL